MIRLKRLFLLSNVIFFSLSHAMEQEQTHSYKFSNDLKSYKKNIDIAEWSLNKESQEFFEFLKRNRSIAHGTYPSVLLHGDRSYNTALALADQLKRPFFIVDGSNKLDDNFIERLEYPFTGSHVIIIKELAYLLALNLENTKSVDFSSKEALNLDDQIENFRKLLHKLKTTRTYLICCENVLDNLPDELKIFFIQSDIDMSTIVEAHPHADEHYFEMLWPIFDQRHNPSLFSSVNSQRYDGKEAVHKLITVFKNEHITPAYANQIVSSVQVKLHHDKDAFQLEDIVRKINLLQKQFAQLKLHQPQALNSARCGLCFTNKNNYYKTPCCLQSSESESIDHIICSECVIHYIDKNNFDCPWCRTKIMVKSRLTTSLEIVGKEKK